MTELPIFTGPSRDRLSRKFARYLAGKLLTPFGFVKRCWRPQTRLNEPVDAARTAMTARSYVVVRSFDGIAKHHQWSVDNHAVGRRVGEKLTLAQAVTLSNLLNAASNFSIERSRSASESRSRGKQDWNP